MTTHARPAMSTDHSAHSYFNRLARGLLSRQVVWVYWVINISLFVGLLAWIFRDGEFSKVANLISQSASWKDTFLPNGAFPHSLTTHVQILQVILIATVFSGIGIFAALFAGSRTNRNLRSWLAVMFALAAWLTLFSVWPDYAGYARAWRIRSNLPAMEKLATTLLANWPTGDGQLPEIGPFTAYPIGKPSTLMLLTTPTVPGTNIQISEINRYADSELQLRLVGFGEGVWLAYVPLQKQPSLNLSCINGLGSELELERGRFLSLGSNWFLVQCR